MGSITTPLNVGTYPQHVEVKCPGCNSTLKLKPIMSEYDAGLKGSEVVGVMYMNTSKCGMKVKLSLSVTKDTKK